MNTDCEETEEQGCRTTLNGCWILDKSRDNWSMNEYLHTMNVDPLAIEAHEKGEKEYETYHTIQFINNDSGIQIVKRSRVNNDVIVELNFGQEYQQYLQPNDRLKSSVATSDHLGHVCIKSSLVTTDNHGTAIVTDIKRLQFKEDTPSLELSVSKNKLIEDVIAKDIATDATEDEKMENSKVEDQPHDPITILGVTEQPLPPDVVMVQELTIQNVETGQLHTTTRYFLPYNDTPPHLVVKEIDDTDMMDE